MRFLREKKKHLALVLALVAVIAMAGTFAWSNFTQSRVNTFFSPMSPDVNLHDDFDGGPNKDVYVENSSGDTVYLRVKLTEHLETKGRGSMVLGQNGAEELGKTWLPHAAEGDAPERCVLPPGDLSPAWVGDAGFHDYYRWTMGGQIFYKPAPPEAKAVYQGKTLVREAQVVNDPLNARCGDTGAYYARQVAGEIQRLTEKNPVEGMEGYLKPEEIPSQALKNLGLRQTLTARVYTMDQWTKSPEEGGLGRAPGDCWVLDNDGWAYWAAPLEPGEATGLLLDRVDRTEKSFDSDSQYKINVWLQAATEDDLAQFWNADLAGGISEDGRALLLSISGQTGPEAGQ